MFQRVIDVSEFQGARIDWPRVASDGILGVCVKATEGTGYIDPDMDYDLQGAQRAGIRAGVYLFLRPGNAVAQVSFFLSKSRGYGQDPDQLPPMLDVEQDPKTGIGPSRQDVLDALSALEDAFGCVPVVYGGRYFLGRLGLDAHCPLWIAEYPAHLRKTWPADGEPVPTFAPWERSTLWQFSSECYDLPGAGPCDSSVFPGSPDDFAAFCRTSRV